MKCHLYVILESFLQGSQGNNLTLMYYSEKQLYLGLSSKLILEFIFRVDTFITT